MPVQVAKWDSARDAWTDESRIDLFSELSDAFLETFPTSGMTVNGVAYELPTWEPATDDSASSSLLKTPTPQLAVNGGSQHPDKRKAGGHGPTLADEIEHLLPTPTTQDGANNGGPSQFNRNTPPLNTRVLMLPTPKASDGEKGGPNQRGSSGDWPLPAIGHLPPTPTVGMMLGGSKTRSGSRNGEKLLPGLVEDIASQPSRELMTSPATEKLTGATTSPPSDAGKLDSAGQLHGQQNLLDAITENA